MTWLDALLVILAVAVAALTAERRWGGVLIAVGGLLMLGPLLQLGQSAPLLALLLGFFFMDYWFEQLSIVVLFELLLFLNLKETAQT